MKTPRCFWIAGIGEGKSERPVIVLHTDPGQWLLAATGTTRDHPEREPPPRVLIRAASRAGKAIGLTRDTWFDRLSFTVDIPPGRFEGPGCYAAGALGVQLIDLFHDCAALGLLGEDLMEVAARIGALDG